MICNIAIQYPTQLSIEDFSKEVVDPQCLKAARFAVRDLKADIDNELVGVKDKFKRIIYMHLERELACRFAVKLEGHVVPKRQEDESVEKWLQNPVMLDVTDESSLVQFIFTADFDPDNASEEAWKNVSVEIKTVVKPETSV